MMMTLQQLAGIIDDEDLFVEEVINRELYKSYSFDLLRDVSIKLLNHPLVQKDKSAFILSSWVDGKFPESFKISKEIDPREEVEGGWKWNGDLLLDDLNWTSPAFEGKPVVEVNGNLDCSEYNVIDLKSLVGSPRKISGSFDVSHNELTSLEGAPNDVGGNFYCSDNKLTSLEGAPNDVGGDFYCDNNKLTSLEGAPNDVGGIFDCYGNKLTSLEGAPKTVGGNFVCANNPGDFDNDDRPNTKIYGNFIW